MTGGGLTERVTAYLDRVVNQRDLSGVDELVSGAYVGGGPGWPTDLTALRQFYEEQYRDRPDWRIEVQEAVELGPSVVVRALAGGRVRVDEGWRARRLEWLSHYRFHDGRIVAITLLEVVPHGVEDRHPTG